MTLSDHIEKTALSIRKWLQPNNESLKQAIDRTVNEKLFTLEDIKYQLRSLRKQITNESLHSWVSDIINPASATTSERDVLALHAGNLPLVGIQDLIVCGLAGVNYYGKLSKKDPYILPTLINTMQEEGALTNPVYSTTLKDFKGLRPSDILFSGSKSSIVPLSEKMKRLGIETNSSHFLARTAHYSLAWIEDDEPETMEALVNAAFRYAGMGCRSVAIVVAPFSLNQIKCHLTDYIEAFWLSNPQIRRPDHSLFYRYAFNRAIERPQEWLDHFLIEENREKPKEPFILYWIPGTRKDVEQLIHEYGDGLQSVYRTVRKNAEKEITLAGKSVENLGDAQNPPVNWTPDGVDTLKWLLNSE
ncbi:MAG: hypothetical protein WD315_00225 [Balneolaceae bacterium]